MTAAPCLCPGCTEANRLREALRVATQALDALNRMVTGRAVSLEEFRDALEGAPKAVALGRATLLDTASLEGMPG